MSRRRIYLGLFAAALVVAGLVSYLAYPHPDGLDTVTRHGCQVTEVNGEEEITGHCIAQNAIDPATAGSTFADYTVGGDDAFTGVAGVVGVLVTLALAIGLFRLLGRRHRQGTTAPAGPGTEG